MSERILKLTQPAFVTIESPDGQHVFREDVYTIHRLLKAAEQKPDEAQRWSYVLDWLAQKWEVNRAELATNMAMQLNNQIMAIVLELNKEISNSFFGTASSPDSTEASPTTSLNGPTK